MNPNDSTGATGASPPRDPANRAAHVALYEHTPFWHLIRSLDFRRQWYIKPVTLSHDARRRDFMLGKYLSVGPRDVTDVRAPSLEKREHTDRVSVSHSRPTIQ
jgi:hypothetical protein